MAKKIDTSKIDINKMFIGGLLLFIGVMMLFRYFNTEKGDVAMVRFDGTDVRYEISLEEDRIIEITEGNFLVTLEVKDGQIRFINSICPDHLCEGFGFISNEDEYAICMPAGVAVLITDER
ncbi:MAG: NusG domain II-containing protein [Oscillospiraceae bacterium]|nr:NusG domain II-containing protein [Oscillospiraceae bacterium]